MPELLEEACGAERVFCVHRLDKAAGGVMVYAKTGPAAARLSESISSRKAQKTYLAVVCGRPEATSGELRDLLFHDRSKNKTYVVDRERRGVKEAVLDYHLLASAETESGVLSLVRVTIHTGRTHQIRVQFASRGLPLAGDGKYGSPLRTCPLALWSHGLSLPHPATGEVVSFSAQPPREFPWEIFDV